MCGYVAGEDEPTPAAQVWKMCQPPSDGGFMLARRDVIVPQSIAWTSTLTPMRPNRSAVTSACAFAGGWSVAIISTIFSPL